MRWQTFVGYEPGIAAVKYHKVSIAGIVMSFADYDVEAQKSNESESSGTVEYISKSLTNFASSLTKLDKLNGQIGTKRDSHTLRKNIEKNVEIQSAQLLRLKDLIFTLQLAKDGDDKKEVVLSKLQKELGELSNSFNGLLRRYNEKKNSAIINEYIDKSENDVAVEQDSEATETTGLLQQQQQQVPRETVNKYDADYHALVVEQREEGITEISQGVQEINAIFKDLNSLVLEQGVQIDTVENNLVNLTNNAQNATQELTKANNYQRLKGKCSCIILVVLAVVALLIVLAIVS